MQIILYVPYTYPHPLIVDQSGKLLSLIVQNKNPVVLKWDTVDNAAHYVIIRDWQEIATITANTYQDSSTGNIYIVKAINTNNKVLAMEGVNLSYIDPQTPTGLKLLKAE